MLLPNKGKAETLEDERVCGQLKMAHGANSCRPKPVVSILIETPSVGQTA